MTKIIAGSSNPKLAKQLSQAFNIKYSETHIERFQDGELRVQIKEDLHNEDVIIVQSTSRPANDNLMELLLLIDTAKRAGARHVMALIPYFGYSRQDKPSYPFGPISARLVASLLETAGVDHVITLDLHSQQSEGFFKVSAQNIDTTPLFIEPFKNHSNIMIVSPDIGGTNRARKLSGLLGTDLAVINKTRQAPNTCQMDEIIGNVSNHHCIIIDDIIDTGETLCKAADLLMKHGALSIEAIASHAVFSGQAITNLENSIIKKIIVTDSITQENLPNKFEVFNIAPLCIKNLQKIIKN